MNRIPPTTPIGLDAKNLFIKLFQKKTATANASGGVSYKKYIAYDKQHPTSVSAAYIRITPMALPGVRQPVTWAGPFLSCGDV